VRRNQSKEERIMELVHEFTYQAKLDPAMVPGPGPLGTRLVVNVTGGWMRGDRINGTISGPGGDWALVGPDGFARLDVRAQGITDDGAVLYMSYTGLLEMNEKVMAATMGGDGTQFEDQYFRTTPRIECGDPRYAWVNQSVFVARGRMLPGAVEYEVYRLT
jgi:hypothetical protein